MSTKTKKSLVTVLILAGSGAACAAALYFEAVPAAVGAVAVAPAPASAPPPAPAPAPPPERPGAAPPVPGPPVATLSVPDFKGRRLSAARRQARTLGIALVARDDEGERVASELAPYYRVRRQLTQAGAAVAPGATVEVRVREVATAQGY